ncbi:M1 family metallopeptidase [Pseudalkalibacillus caeni]|uniref:M1 family metallopeptidase n=1 Tax=Exobacillus caeni TaxID=2574798 RepID=UPI001484E9E6|nr:M1 family metallopeptidase [Pseudalkalibacillus caeni]
MKLKHILKRAFQSITVASLTVSLALPVSASSMDPGEFAKQNGAYTPAGNPSVTIDHSAIAARKKLKDKDVLGPVDPAYTMDVSYDSENHHVSGTMNVTFKNNIMDNLENLYFNLWGNAETFAENGGGMDVANIKVNGKKAEYEMNGTSLHISGLSLKENKPVNVEMDFEVNLPEQQDRFGWYKDTVSMGNWFPILSVYDDEGWNVDPYYPYGEAFYSVSGSYDVTVTTEKEQVIAATGTEIGQPTVHGDLATHRYKAFNVRDFAMEMNPNYHVISTKVNNVDVNVYYSDEHAKYADALLESGAESIQLFSEKFGKYPWPELDVVTMEGWFGGMEYPQLVMISFSGERSLEWTKSVNAHEIGHQWFYGIIGDNEYDEPWLDESFASFAASLYDGELDSLEVPPVPDEYYHLSSPVSDFTARASEGGINYYYWMIYGYGSSTLNDLRQELGDSVFYEAMRSYFKEQKFGVSSTEEFISAMERSSGMDLSEFFNSHRVFVSDQQ